MKSKDKKTKKPKKNRKDFYVDPEKLPKETGFYEDFVVFGNVNPLNDPKTEVLNENNINNTNENIGFLDNCIVINKEKSQNGINYSEEEFCDFFGQMEEKEENNESKKIEGKIQSKVSDALKYIYDDLSSESEIELSSTYETARELNDLKFSFTPNEVPSSKQTIYYPDFMSNNTINENNYNKINQNNQYFFNLNNNIKNNNNNVVINNNININMNSNACSTQPNIPLHIYTSNFNYPYNYNKPLMFNNNSSIKTEEKDFKIDIRKVLSFENTKSTLMIKNIPNKFSLKILLAIINQHFKNAYDLFVLPTDSNRYKNFGYGFINLINSYIIPHFYFMFYGKMWNNTNSKKCCEITYSKIQGKNNLINHYLNKNIHFNDVDLSCLNKYVIPNEYKETFRKLYKNQPIEEQKYVFLTELPKI